MSALIVLVMTGLIIAEAMLIVAMAAYYAGRQAKVAPMLQEFMNEYERFQEAQRANDEGIRGRP